MNVDYRAQAVNSNRMVVKNDADGDRADLDGELLKFYN